MLLSSLATKIMGVMAHIPGVGVVLDTSACCPCNVPAAAATVQEYVVSGVRFVNVKFLSVPIVLFAIFIAILLQFTM